MNIDPSTNMVVFEIRGLSEPHVTSGATRDDYCIQRAWMALPVDHRSAAPHVSQIYSEWQPSPADAEFIRNTFPRANVTFSFERPGPDGWDAALASARLTIEQATSQRDGGGAQQATGRQEAELLPVLWSRTSPNSSMLQFLPHHDLVPGRLHLALAEVAMTPDGRIGMNHVTHAQLGDRPFGDMVAAAAGALAAGLRIDGHTDPDRPEKGDLLVLRREGPFASSAVALPNFHDRMASALGGAGGLLVGLPDPDTVLVTRIDSGWVGELRHAVLASPCPSSELVPSVLAFEPSDSGRPAPRLVEERPDPQHPPARQP
ncbi:MAG TPA: hypothetical protein VF062_00470 [Candidatus Limnocylindrales bacterium]